MLRQNSTYAFTGLPGSNTLTHQYVPSRSKNNNGGDSPDRLYSSLPAVMHAVLCQPIHLTSQPRNFDVAQRFGQRLRDLRRAHRMTQIDMAVTFGIDRSYISGIECGKTGVSLTMLEIIALGYQIKLSDLLYGI